MFRWIGKDAYHADAELKYLLEDVSSDIPGRWGCCELAKQWEKSDASEDREEYMKARNALFETFQKMQDAAETQRLAEEKQKRDVLDKQSMNCHSVFPSKQGYYTTFIKGSGKCGTKSQFITFGECVKSNDGYMYPFYAQWTEFVIIKKSGSFTLTIDENGEPIEVEKNIAQR